MSVKILAMGSLLPAEMQVLEDSYDVLRLWKAADPEKAIRDNALEIQGILSCYNAGAVRKSLIEALPNLEIIAQFGAGLDNIDLQTAFAHQIQVTHTPDILTEDTADIAFSLILALMRRLVEAEMYVRVGKWHQGAFPLGSALSGKTAGIVGLGRIGSAVARRADAFGMRVAYHGPRRKPDAPYTWHADLKTLAAESDVLVLACPGGPDTEGLVDFNILQALGSSGYVVNVARGPVIVEDDLLAALSNRTIAGAGLDVYWKEPSVPEALLSMDNVVLLPHIGSATLETRSAMGQLVLRNLKAHFDGKTPPATVRPPGG